MICNTQEASIVFEQRVARFKDSMRMIREKQNLFARIFYNVKVFGFVYVRYMLMRISIFRFEGDTHSILFWGREMVLPREDIGTHVIALHGMMPHQCERRLTRFMLHNLTSQDVLYDVGAHFGFYTALGEYLLPDGEVHAFEANNKLCGYLTRNFSESKTVHLSCNAVADTVRDVDFYDATDTVDSSASSRFDILDTHIAPITVRAISLDVYVEGGKRPPTIIKIDIEGGEYDALVGAEKLIAMHKPRIIMEVWGGELGKKYSTNAVEKLQKLGYQAYAFMGDGSLSLQPIHDPVESIPFDPNGSRDNFIFIPSTIL